MTVLPTRKTKASVQIRLDPLWRQVDVYRLQPSRPQIDESVRQAGGAENVRDTFANSRTTRSNALVRWLAWNMPYHTEHHLYPSVPFHALPRLHALVSERLREVRPGYVALNRALWRALPNR